MPLLVCACRLFFRLQGMSYYQTRNGLICAICKRLHHGKLPVTQLQVPFRPTLTD